MPMFIGTDVETINGTKIPLFQSEILSSLWDAYCNEPSPRGKCWERLFEAVEETYGISLPIIPTVQNMMHKTGLTPQYYTSATADPPLADPSEANFTVLYPVILMIVSQMFYGIEFTSMNSRHFRERKEIETYILRYAPTVQQFPRLIDYSKEKNYCHAATIFIIEIIQAALVHGMGKELIAALCNPNGTGKFFVHTLSKFFAV